MNAPPALSAAMADLRDRLDRADSAEQVRFAVEAIAAARLPEAVTTLIEVLGYNNPGAAVAAVDGLIAIGEPAVMPLIELLDGYNYGARAWALRALAGIGDPRGKALLLHATLEDFALSVRRAAARGVGTLRWQDFPAAAVVAAQLEALTTLSKSATVDPEWVVRYAAVTGLEALGLKLEPALVARHGDIVDQLAAIATADAELGVRARAQLALQRLTA